MPAMLEIFMFLLGLVFLIKGSDWVVDASARFAKQAGISEIIIGLTIVAVGTSLPETANSITAALSGKQDLALGNIIGSNIANIASIVGVSALFMRVTAGREIYYRDALLLFASSILLMVFAADGGISHAEGIFLLSIFVAYTAFLWFMKEKLAREMGLSRILKDIFYLGMAPRMRNTYRYSIYSPGLEYESRADIGKKAILQTRKLFTIVYDIISDEKKIIRYALLQIFYFSAGLAMLVIGSGMVVGNVESLPLPPIVTGLVIVSLGTTLPELMVAIASIRKNHPMVMVGNAIGSVLTNTFLILGISAFINPIEIGSTVFLYYIPYMILVNLLFILFLRTKYSISRAEGGILFLSYICFILLSIFYFK